MSRAARHVMAQRGGQCAVARQGPSTPKPVGTNVAQPVNGTARHDMTQARMTVQIGHILCFLIFLPLQCSLLLFFLLSTKTVKILKVKRSKWFINGVGRVLTKLLKSVCHAPLCVSFNFFQPKILKVEAWNIRSLTRRLGMNGTTQAWHNSGPSCAGTT